MTTLETTLYEALHDLWNDRCGEPKSCGHDFPCRCPASATVAALFLYQRAEKEEIESDNKAQGKSCETCVYVAFRRDMMECKHDDGPCPSSGNLSLWEPNE